jgi:hypothetical protein
LKKGYDLIILLKFKNKNVQSINHLSKINLENPV